MKNGDENSKQKDMRKDIEMGSARCVSETKDRTNLVWVEGFKTSNKPSLES